ncbi:hypothetical protein M7775_17235 [Sporomusa sphaeroides DSM 2875]|uniref:hypothetical protein n=1 Tax=Sporomusa sphaeroides TaxID=47679 RepID=UPI00202E2BBA|nr:hypothetical protein [Sporomusa sphaeroides]MCM0760300.1 hypothetical protein [Sporomusa sphaeroides DSM 2875]
MKKMINGNGCSLAAEDVELAFSLGYPAWPPAELSPHVYGLLHVGQPHQGDHGKAYDKKNHPFAQHTKPSNIDRRNK